MSSVGISKIKNTNLGILKEMRQLRADMEVREKVFKKIQEGLLETTAKIADNTARVKPTGKDWRHVAQPSESDRFPLADYTLKSLSDAAADKDRLALVELNLKKLNIL